MENNNLDDLMNIMREIITLNEKELKKLKESVDRLINAKIKDEDIISLVFDRMLSLVFIDENELKTIYYKLLNYTKSFNEELSKDYEEIYIDQNENKRIK